MARTKLSCEAYRILADTIRVSYLRLVSDKLRLTRTEYNNTRVQDVLKRSEGSLLTKKEISEAQMFSIRIDAERSEITTERTRMEFENAKQSFSRLTGLPELADDQIPDEIPPVHEERTRLAGRACRLPCSGQTANGGGSQYPKPARD